MKTSQDKFFEILEVKASARDLQLVVDKNWANVGLILLQKPGSFETALELPFDFQPGRASFGWMGRPADKPDVFPEQPNPKYAGFKASEFGEAIEAILKAAEVKR